MLCSQPIQDPPLLLQLHVLYLPHSSSSLISLPAFFSHSINRFNFLLPISESNLTIIFKPIYIKRWNEKKKSHSKYFYTSKTKMTFIICNHCYNAFFSSFFPCVVGLRLYGFAIPAVPYPNWNFIQKVRSQTNKEVNLWHLSFVYQEITEARIYGVNFSVWKYTFQYSSNITVQNTNNFRHTFIEKHCRGMTFGSKLRSI